MSLIAFFDDQSLGTLVEVRTTSTCPYIDEKENLTADIYKILSSNYGVPILGLIKQIPAETNGKIRLNNPLSKSGLYWIQANSTVQRHICHFE